MTRAKKKPDNKKVKGGDSGKVSAVKTKSLDKSSEPKKGLTDEQKRFARNVVIGAAVTAAVLGTAYVGYKYAKGQSSDKTLNAFGDALERRGKELGAKLSEVPIDSLSDNDTFIQKGSQTFQRIVVGTDKGSVLMKEKTSEVLYATYTEKDNNFYKSVFASIMQKNANTGKQFISTMTNINDLRIPSEKKRVSVFVDLIKNDSNFKATFENELSKHSPLGKVTIDPNKAQGFYKDFVTMFGNKDSTSRKTYIQKLAEMGYNALIDDNDANRLGEAPIIALNGTNDMAITNIKKLSSLTKMLAGLKLEDFDFDKW